MIKRKLSYEILGMIALSAVLALVLGLILAHVTLGIVAGYCSDHDIVMTEFDWIEADRWIVGMSVLLSAGVFSILFLALLNDRIVYIQRITAGIDGLRDGRKDSQIPLEGNNELTALAGAINEMSRVRQQLQEKEQALNREKEQFIRTLSHDIRTPLTSILSYAQYLTEEEGMTPSQKTHLQTICRKAEQIRDLTQLLLDGDRREPEHFDDAHLLMEQLAAEFEETLEERFAVCTDLSRCPSFAGTFDVRELRRIFDNLSSNVLKYADPHQPVQLKLWTDGTGLCIRQENGVLPRTGEKDSYKLGLHSIRRIAQNYGGRVQVEQDRERFSIMIIFSDF